MLHKSIKRGGTDVRDVRNLSIWSFGANCNEQVSVFLALRSITARQGRGERYACRSQSTTCLGGGA